MTVVENGKPTTKSAPRTDIISDFDKLVGQLRNMLSDRVAAEQRETLAYEMGQQFNSITDVYDLLDLAVERLASAFNYYHVHVYLYDDADDRLVVAAGLGEAGQQMVRDSHSISLSSPRSLVASAARSMETVVVQDVMDNPDHLANPMLPYTRSEVAMPLSVGSSLVGVLDVQSDQEDHFTDNELRTLSIITNQLAIALSNNRLLQQTMIRLRDVQVSNSAATIISRSETLDDLIDQILEVVMDALNADEATFAQYDALGDMWQFRSGVGQNIQATREEIQNVRQPGNEHKYGLRALDTNEIVYVDHADGHPEFSETITEERGVQSVAAIPLITPRGSLGVIFVSYINEEHLFTPEDVTLMDAIARQIGIGIENKQLEEETRRREEYYRLLIEGSTTITSILNADGTIKYLSPSFERILGHKNDTIIGTNIFDLFHEDDLEAAIEEFQRFAASNEEEGLVTRYRLRHKSGGYRLLESTSRDELANPVIEGIIINSRDITEVAAQEERFRLMVETAPEAILVIDMNTGKFVQASQSVADLYEMTPEELLQTGPVEAAPEFQPDGRTSAEVVTETIGTLFETGVTVPVEWLIETKSGEVKLTEVRSSILPSPNPDDRLIRTSIIDISARKTAEEAIQKRAIELQTVAEVSAEAASRLDIDKLLDEVVDLTKERFDLYHAHIYLLDKDRKEMVLAAGAGEAGTVMLKHDHRIAMDNETSIVARAARTGRPVRVEDVSASPTFMPNPLLPYTASEMAVPMVAGNNVIGVLDVQADVIGRFTDEDERIKSTLAAQIAIALENARAFEEANKRAVELETVAQVSAEAASRLNIDELLQDVADLTKERFNLYHAHIYLLNDAGDTLVLTAGAGEVGRQMVAEHRIIPLNAEQSIVAEAARTYDSIVVNNVTEEEHFLPHPLLPDTRSEMAIPMVVGEDLIGVLDVQGDVFGRFTAEDVRIKSTLAAQIAIAIQNARSVESSQKRADELALLSEVGTKAAAILDPDELVREVTHLTATAFDLYNLNIWIADETGENLSVLGSGGRAQSMHDESHHTINIHEEDSLVTLAARKLENQLTNNAQEDPDFLPSAFLPETRSQLAVPMLVGTTLIGVIDVQSDRPNAFSSEDLLIQTTNASQIAIAIQNARSFAESQRRAAEMETVAKVSAQASTNLDTETLLLDVVNLTKEAFDLYHAHVYLLDSAGDNLVLTAGAGEAGRRMLEEGLMIPYDREDSIVAQAARTGAGIIVNDVTQNPNFLPNALLPDTRSELAVPLIYGNEVIGVLDVQSTRVNRFNAQDVQIQTTLASQIAVAVQNARAFENVRLRDSAVSASTTALTIADATDPELPLIYVNPAFEKVTGYSIAEAIGRNCRFLQNDDRDQEALDDLRAAIKRGKQATVVLRNYRKDGEMFYNELSISPIFDESGDLTHFVGASTDVTQRVLEEKRNVLLSAVNSALSEATDEQSILAAYRSMLQAYGINLAALAYAQGDDRTNPDYFEITMARINDVHTPPEQLPDTYVTEERYPTLRLMLDNPSEGAFISSISEVGDKNTQKWLRETGQEALILLPLRLGSEWVGYLGLTWTEPQTFGTELIEVLLASQAGLAATVNDRRNVLEQQERARRNELNAHVSDALSQATHEDSILAAYSPVFGEYGATLATLVYAFGDDRRNPDYLDNVAARFNNEIMPADQLPERIITPDTFPTFNELMNSAETGVFIPDADDLEDPGTKAWLKELGMSAFVLLPLVDNRGEWVGLVSMSFEEPQAFDESFRAVLFNTRPALTKVVAERRERLAEQERAQRNELVGRVVEKLSQATDEDSIIEAYQEIAQRYEMGVAGLGYAFGENLAQRPDYYHIQSILLNGEPAPVDAMPTTFISEESYPVIGMMVDSPDEVLYIEDITTDERVVGTEAEDFLAQLNQAALVLVPLRSGRQWLGYLATSWTEPQVFTNELRDVLERTGPALAATVADRRAFFAEQERSRRNELLSQVADGLTQANNEDEVLKAYSALTEQVGAGFISLGYPIGDASAARPDGFETVALLSGGEITSLDVLPQTIFTEDESPIIRFLLDSPDDLVFIEDVTIDPVVESTGLHEAMEAFNIQSMIIIPLRTGREWQGYVTITWDEPQTFPRELIQLFDATQPNLTSVVASRRAFLAEEAARRENERRARELETVARVSAATTTMLDMKDLLQNVSDLTKEAFDLYHAHIYLMDEDGHELVLAAGAGEAGKVMLKHDHRIAVDHPTSIVAEAARSANPIRVDDVSQSPTFMPNPLLPYTAAEMAIPLIVANDVIGVLDVQSDQIARFNIEDERIKGTLASQLAIAIRNARAFAAEEAARFENERRARELETVARVSAAASTILDVSQLLHSVVDLTKHAFDLYHAHIYLLDDENEDLLVLAAGADEAGAMMLQHGHSISIDHPTSIVARCARERNGVIVNDVSQSPTFMPNPLLPYTNAEMAIPIVVGNELIGILDVQSDMIDRFDDEDVRIKSTLAAQVGVAVENARAFARSEQIAEQERATAEQMRDVSNLKSQFLASMSHELRTPLNSIIGYSEVLLDGGDGDLNEDAEEDIEIIYNSGKHLLAIINDILDLAKIEAEQMKLDRKDVDIVPLLRHVVKTNEVLVRDRPIEVRLESDMDVLIAPVDELRIRQVVLNLFSNALKFTNEGHVIVRLTMHDDETARIDVEDTGIGISPEGQKVVFDQFRQVDGSSTRRAGGTGLGLTITRYLVQMHGGDISVESEEGVGSTFWFTLPLIAPEEIDEETEANPA